MQVTVPVVENHSDGYPENIQIFPGRIPLTELMITGCVIKLGLANVTDDHCLNRGWTVIKMWGCHYVYMYVSVQFCHHL